MAVPRPLPDPYSCRVCGVPFGYHGRRYDSATGMHTWQGPSMALIKARMLARRAARTNPNR